MTDAVWIHDLPHRRAVELLRSGAPVFAPVDPVEYHGPHLSLHNDHWIAIGVARDIHARIAAQHRDGRDWPLLMASNLELGVEPTAGPGTRPMGYRTVKPLVEQAAIALSELGARRVVFVTFHGTPLHSRAIHAGTRALRARGVIACSPMNALFFDQIHSEPDALRAALMPAVETVAAAERGDLFDTLRADFHGGFMETSVALHHAPHTVDDCYRTLPDCPTLVPDAALDRMARIAARMGDAVRARELAFGALGVAWSKLRPFPGYTGRPRHANAAAGAIFARYVADRASQVVLDVLDGAAPPEPVMGWLHATTLGGRLPGADALQRLGTPS